MLVTPDDWAEERVQKFAAELNRLAPEIAGYPNLWAVGRIEEFYATAKELLSLEMGESVPLGTIHALTSQYLPCLLTIYGLTLKEHQFDTIHKLLTTVVNKNQSYGNSFDRAVDDFGATAAILRLYDKVNRMESLLNGTENNVKDESIKDTMLDILGYLVLTLHYTMKKKGYFDYG